MIQLKLEQPETPVTEKRDFNGDGGIQIAGGLGLNNPLAISALFQGGMRPNASGEIINDFTAQNISFIFIATRLISTAIAATPIRLYKSSIAGFKDEDLANPLHRILSLEANPHSSAYTLIETLMLHTLITGNGVLEVQRNAGGEVVGLWNIDPRLTRPVLLPGNQLAFETRDGETGGNYRVIPATNAIHLPWGSWGGVWGHSPISRLSETLGLARSMERLQGQSLSNGGGAPSVVLKNASDLPMDPAQIPALRADFEKLMLGPNRRRAFVIDKDWELTTLGFSMVDADLLKQKAFTREEVAAAYGLPTYLLGDSEKLTRANASELGTQLVTNCFLPIARQLELELKRKLLPVTSQGHIMLDFRERLRGSFSETMTAISTGLQNGVYTRNEARRILNESPIDGPEGDYLTAQVNMTNIANLAPGKDPSIEAPDDADQDEQDAPAATRAYLPMVRDAVTRTLNGTPSAQAFGPIVESLCESRGIATPEVLTSLLSGIERRSKQWTSPEAAEGEMEKLTRSLTYAAKASEARKELEA